MQHKDEQTQEPGFLTVHMPVWMYVMHGELTELQQNWRTADEFKPFVVTVMVASNKKAALEEFGNLFFEIAIKTFIKNFNQWRCENLQVALGGEKETATYLARWLVRTESEEIPAATTVDYQSEKHCTTINLPKMLEYLTQHQKAKELLQRRFYLEHCAAVMELSRGKSLWDDEETSQAVLQF
jgi:hypothetical protein